MIQTTGNTKSSPSTGIVLTSKPDPFSQHLLRSQPVAGLTIAQIIEVENVEVLHYCGARVEVDAVVIPRDKWSTFVVEEGSLMLVMAVPGKGGGKNPLKFVLSLAVFAAAPYLGGQLAATGLFGGLSTSFLTGAVGLIGSLAINALIPPPKPGGGSVTRSERDSPTYNINGAKNEARPLGVIPVNMGFNRVFPPHFSEPYTSLRGREKDVNLLFCLSDGEHDAFDLKIGETAIDQFIGIDYNILYVADGSEEFEIFPKVVEEDVSSIELTQAGGFNTRTTDSDANMISVDIEFPRGLVRFDDEGNKQSHAVNFDIQYRPTSGGTWSAGNTFIATAQIDFDVPNGRKTWGGFAGNVARPAEGFVHVDKATGVVRNKLGPTRQVLPGFSGGGPGGSLVPSTSWLLATWSRAYNGSVVVVDKRSAAALASFQDGADYLVTALDADTIRCAAGDLKLPITVTMRDTETVRRTYKFKTDPIVGTYDVRIRRNTADSSDTKIFDKSFWTVLRTHKNTNPIGITDVTVCEMRIQGSNQLNGIVDEFNCLLMSKPTGWNTEESEWDTDAPSENPADMFRYALQGEILTEAVPDSLIDLTALETWAVYCEARKFRFSQYIDFEASLEEILERICAAGRAQLVRLDGSIWSVVIDQERTTPEALITPANSWGYEMEKVFRKTIHAVEINFANAEMGFKLDTRTVYNDGYDINTATEIEKIDAPGINYPEHIFKMGRNLMAQAELRPNKHIFYQDPEFLALSPGAMFTHTHPVPLHGVGSGRIEELLTSGADITALVLDNSLSFDSDSNWTARVRRGSTWLQTTYPLTVAVGTTDTMTLTTPTLISGGPQVGDLVAVGDMGTESKELIVRRIEPAADLNARIEAVDHAPGIESADFGEIPEYMSMITVPAGLEQPVFGTIYSDEQILRRSADGSLISRIHINFDLVSGRPYHKLENLELQYRLSNPENDYTALPLLSNDATSVFIENIDDGELYDLRARYRYFGGSNGPWAETTHQAIGKSSLPPDVSNFLVARQADGTRRFSWDYPDPPLDLLGFIIGFKSGSSHAWADLEPLFAGQTKIRDMLWGIQNASPFESNELAGGSWTIGIKAVDTSLNESNAASIIELTLGDPRIGNALYFQDEHQQGWPGVKTNCSVDAVSGNLIPDDQAAWSDWTLWSAETKWAGDPPATMTYLTEEIDLGAIVTVMPVVSALADGATIAIKEQHKDTSGDSYSTLATWSTEITSRFFKLEVVVTTPTENGLTSETVTMDADIVMEQLLDYDTSTDSSPAGDLDIPLLKTFAIISTVDVTLQNVGPGWSWELLDKVATGPNIKIYDETDTLADATVDITVRGL